MAYEEEEEAEEKEVVLPDPAKLQQDLEVLALCRGYPEFANIHAYVYEDLVQSNTALGVVLAERRRAEAEAKAAELAEAAARAKEKAEADKEDEAA